MSDWTSGYVADINYTFGYYAELNPLRIDLAFINAGIRPPDVVNACELGFGQGMSTNLHAAASRVNWYGTDFNPRQVAFAREVAGVSQSGAQLFDDAFDQFCQRDDLPEFDFIGLHGIWSWISNENRAVVVNFIRRKLKVGGVLFISYNTQPGWAAMVPMRDLLVEHSEVMSAPGAGTLARVDDAMAFAEKLIEVDPRFCQANPQIKGRIEKMRKDNKNYLAHEYFNRDWEPMGFSKMASWLSSAKMEWATSARYVDSIDAIQLSREQRALLESISDPMFRQTVRDFCENRQFRTDYWIKGGQHLSTIEQNQALDQLRIIMIMPRSHVELKIAGHVGSFDLPDTVYQPLLDILDNYQPITIAELRQQLEGILHPRINALARERAAAIGNRLPHAVVIYEAPLLLESGADAWVDRVVVVDLPEALQRQRATERGERGTEQVQAIMDAQCGRQERLARADDVIDNSGPWSATAERVEALMQRYRALAGEGPA